MTTYQDEVRKAYFRRRAEGHRPQQAKLIARHDAKYGNDGRLGPIARRKRDLMPDYYTAYDGEEITTLPNGWQIKVEFQRDDDMREPWREDGGHGVVTGWQGYDERLENWELNSDHRSYRYYDWRASLKIALRDGWGARPYGVGTKHEQAMRAVKADYENLRRWCTDQWWWVGMIVTLLDENGDELAEESVWGFESDSMDYLTSEARSWAARMIRKERAGRREARRQERIANRWRDAQNLGIV